MPDVDYSAYIYHDGSQVDLDDRVEMIEGPYMGWMGYVAGYGDEPGWMEVEFDIGNTIEVPTNMARREEL